MDKYIWIWYWFIPSMRLQYHAALVNKYDRCFCVVINAFFFQAKFIICCLMDNKWTELFNGYGGNKLIEYWKQKETHWEFRKIFTDKIKKNTHMIIFVWTQRKEKNCFCLLRWVAFLTAVSFMFMISIIASWFVWLILYIFSLTLKWNISRQKGKALSAIDLSWGKNWYQCGFKA